MKKVLALLMAICLVLGLAACGGSEPAAAPAAPAAAPAAEASGELEPIVIKFGTSMSSTEFCTSILVKWIEEVEKVSEGKITFDYYPGGALGNGNEHAEQTELGILPMNMSEISTYETYVPEIGVMYNPFIVKSYDHQVNIIYGEAGDHIRELFQKNTNTTLIGWYISGARNVMSTVPINNLADAKDVIIRVPEIQIYNDCFKLLGMSPTPLAYSEMYTGLQTGVVEACECPLPALYDGGYGDVAPNLCLTGHMYGNAVIAVNTAYWNSLPAEYQTILIECFENLKDEHNKAVMDMDAGLVDNFKADGVNVSEISDIADLTDTFNEFYNSFAEKLGPDAVQFKDLIQATKG